MKISKPDIEVEKANIGSRSRRWDFGFISSEWSVEAVRKSVCFHTISRNKRIDLFPRTSAVEKTATLRSKKPLINSRERTAQSGGFLTSIRSNRAMWRRCAFCPNLNDDKMFVLINLKPNLSLMKKNFKDAVWIKNK